MNGGEAFVGEALVDLAEAAEAFVFLLIGSPWFLRIGHDADEFGAESLHAGDGALDFGEGEVEIRSDRFGPVSDERAELGDGDAFCVELICDGLKLVLWEFVNVGAVDTTSGDVRPSDFFGGLDLGGEVGGGFVGKSGEIHGIQLLGSSD